MCIDHRINGTGPYRTSEAPVSPRSCVVQAAGCQRSGSTWQYVVLRELSKWCFASSGASQSCFTVQKSHWATDAHRPCARFATCRRVEDAVASQAFAPWHWKGPLIPLPKCTRPPGADYSAPMHAATRRRILCPNALGHPALAPPSRPRGCVDVRHAAGSGLNETDQASIIRSCFAQTRSLAQQSPSSGMALVLSYDLLVARPQHAVALHAAALGLSLNTTALAHIVDAANAAFSASSSDAAAQHDGETHVNRHHVQSHPTARQMFAPDKLAAIRAHAAAEDAWCDGIAAGQMASTPSPPLRQSQSSPTQEGHRLELAVNRAWMAVCDAPSHGDSTATGTIAGPRSASFVSLLVRLPNVSKYARRPAGRDHLSGLNAACTHFANAGAPLTAYVPPSQHGAIREAAPSCGALAALPEYDELWGVAASTDVHEECGLKMDWNSQLGRAKWTPRGEVRRLANIWLSKPRLLCEHAVKRPDALTVFIDAGLAHDADSWANMRRAVCLHQNGTLGVQAYDLLHYHGRKSGDAWRALRWFNRVGCTAPIANARFMTVRGRDCARLMSAYDAALADERQGCGCFDEESTLARMFHRWPSLLKFVGVLSAGSHDKHETNHTCASVARNQARGQAGNASRAPPNVHRRNVAPLITSLPSSAEQPSPPIPERGAAIEIGASGAPALLTARDDRGDACSLLFRSVAPACPVRPRPASRVVATCGRPEYLILGTRKGGTTSLHYCKRPSVECGTALPLQHRDALMLAHSSHIPYVTRHSNVLARARMWRRSHQTP